ncbi:MAG: ABC transporter permease subunit [Geminicoccaceae bacterium]|nr:ABC transporter permease subunit [Geminicoccaceae bacterium]MCX8100712.1 ABC transporter permease subunit [Geminicoccaceae bacterium]MDW8371147.1 ABC transporter permease subunit [Geminicoccaceae bacterium]
MSAPSPTEAIGRAATGEGRIGLLLVAPALLVVAGFFLVPLGLSVVWALTDREGALSLANLDKAVELYRTDILFTLVLVTAATALTGLLAVLIGGWLVLGENPTTVAILRWLYRLPLFVPFVVAAQTMSSFLAKNGLMNHALITAGLIGPLQAQSFLDWRGVLVTFVWKQTPFVTLMVAGAMAALDRSLIEAARNMGAGRPRILWGILLPLVRPTLLVGLVLSFVTMLSVLSVPVMINAGSPTLITVDMAYRITAHGDYGVANALGLISCLMASSAAWLYLRTSLRGRAAP